MSRMRLDGSAGRSTRQGSVRCEPPSKCDDASGSDEIVLPAGTYQLSLTGSGDDGGDLDAHPVSTTGESLTLRGAGANSTRIVGNGSDRVIQGDVSLVLNITGVTISGGTNVVQGGGILAGSVLNLSDSAVVDNTSTTTSTSPAEGGGVYAASSSTLRNVTISGNVMNTGGNASGGGLYSENGTSNLTNVTISGNSVSGGFGSQGGGLFGAAGVTMRLQNATIAGNTVNGPAANGAGVFGGANLTFANTIVALNRTTGGTPSNCGGSPPGTSAGHNLEEGTDCLFTGAGDKRGVDPLLGPLADNGGPTPTRALLAGSPALDAGDNATCPSTDQRGTTRPQNATCDIGAFELVPAALPPVLPPPPLPKPVLGQTVNVRPLSGKVLFAIPPGASAAGVRASQKGLRFRPLSEARQLPVRSFLNTRKGKVRLVSARNRAGSTQSAIFTSGLFQILQSRKQSAKGLTELRLKGSSFNSCKPRKRKQGKRAQAALSKRAIRRLRSAGKGRFRTRGRYSAATVRGTKWLTVDRCDGTLTKVTRGQVAVRDFRRKKTIRVKRGKSYLAKSPRSG